MHARGMIRKQTNSELGKGCMRTRRRTTTSGYNTHDAQRGTRQMLKLEYTRLKNRTEEQEDKWEKQTPKDKK